jgi:hypothetical protein
VLRTYVNAHVYTLPDWNRVGAFRLPRQPQGEALTAVRGGRSLLAGTEGSPTRIDLVDVPRRLTAALRRAAEATEATEATEPADAGEAASASAARDAPADDGGISRDVLIGLGAVVLAGAGVLLAARRRRG